MIIRIVMLLVVCLFGLAACSGSSSNSLPPGPEENAPQIIGLAPIANDPSVLRGALISATFDLPMNAATSNSFVVYGSLTGILAGVYAGGGTQTLTFNANNSFMIGESIEVILTDNLTSTSGQTLALPFVYRFYVECFPGTGFLAVPKSVLGQNGVVALSAGDFDGDRDIDLAAANFGSNSVTILRNDPLGTFTQVGAVPNQTGVIAMALGDFDGDGDLDIASANFGINRVAILRNNPPGTFTQVSVISNQTGVSGLAVGDLDGDGDLDLAAANSTAGGIGSVAILKNDGNGGFTQTGNVANQTGVIAVELGDFDGDGDLDLAAANFGSNSVTILENDGSGTFTQVGAVPNQTGVSGLAVGDLDGDGDLDLGAANLAGNRVDILAN